MGTFYDYHLKECKVECETTPGCKSIMYRPNNKECVINSYAVADTSELIFRKWYKYYSMDCGVEAPKGQLSNFSLSIPQGTLDAVVVKMDSVQCFCF